ncbi:MAG: cytochrome C [Opitutae bacterium]|nr:cytochrome C [Opitutae bacterium]|tara:strand:- start:2812 stop:3468 length:657 start_codon:yes stop_codon:yes gene_type:complete
MRYFIPIFFIFVVTIFSIMGFRGDLTENTPLEVFPDMDRQAKYKSQTQNDFYGDKKADRLPVPGTAIRGTALEINNVFSEKPTFSNLAFRTGKIDEDSDSWVSKIPDEAQIDMSLMRLGKERYDIHCAICHGTYGNGNGVMKEFLGVAPRNLSDPELTNYLEPAGRIPDGKIFHTISMGAGNMLGLKDKLSPKERWAIVLYVRTLQSYVSEAQSSAKN